VSTFPSDDWPPIARRLKLTNRESQVLFHIWQGDKFMTIAHGRGLRISRHTVDTHWRHIKRKLRVHNRVEAIEVVHEHQLHAAIEAATTPLNEQINALKQQIRELEGEVVRLQHSE
jgi:DNA-binding CsgD family transcriptional regulator